MSMPKRPANLLQASKLVVSLRKRRDTLRNKLRGFKKKEAIYLDYIATLERHSDLKPKANKWEILNKRKRCKIPSLPTTAP